ncbi:MULTISPECIES: ABC transporter ATP-binding protein [unclassified Nocardioides]|uniref:ABC transporter ATP-binding protein n=1 Tax=unclassified Nocardioides TaxID=2615069 RepID=UPI00005710F1|nr:MULTISPECIES: ABC transporter ATP-binding protein [unclassified Nocardioides]ABL83180.1 carbohydrate ABC transporter ATP-binding protein, CUT1 family [Nocardioides sp. JS614]
MAAVELRHVSKIFGSKTTVDDISLTLPDGQLTVLVGPSGCGKTTTLRMIAGLEAVSHGSIHFDGEDVTGGEPRTRDVSMVFQNYALYPHLTVQDNLAFPVLARGGKRADAIRRAREAAEMLGLTELLQRKPGQLSGGQQQRVAIGRAVVREPRVFLFDEPLSNLDARLRVEMRSEILRLQRQLGVTAVYVTHDQEEAMTMSDSMVVMDGGTIAQQGSPREVYAAPATTFVAGFVGSPRMNLIAGRVVGGVFESRWGRVPMGAADQEGSLGVRPELVRLVGADHNESSRARNDPGAGAGAAARVELVELLGPRAIVSLNADGERLIAVVEARDLSGIHEGSLVDVDFASAGLHFFEAGGQRLLTT